MKVFIDTNVLASAFATRGLCADVVREVMSEHELIVGEYVLTELHRVLRLKFHVPETKIHQISLLLNRFSVEPNPKDLKGLHVRDKDDIPVLGSAIACTADILITGDRDLLILGKQGDLLIMTPRNFWEYLRGRDRRENSA